MTDALETRDNLGGRLQRPGKALSRMVTSFSQVVIRHGLTMLTVLAILLIALEFGVGQQAVMPGLSLPLSFYLGAGVLMMVFAAGFWRIRGTPFEYRQWMWLAYLFAISVVEEMAFRVFAPILFDHAVEPRISVLLSNAVFAGLHYLTLRWRFSNCVWVFLGGLGLARLFHETEDLALIIGVHWFATFLNTPTPPSGHRA
ncbi:MAG: CPBP family intramembrane glutamic endopeptidase [Pseudomonadales bacterium]